jgi:hypothetical protein
VTYRNSEQHEIEGAFSDMLRAPTGDGGNKRAAGLKVHWKVDPSHEDALHRHLQRWMDGERYDADSGAHALAHVAWRALALAYQQMSADGHFEPNPSPVLPEPIAPLSHQGPAPLPREPFDVIQ